MNNSNLEFRKIKSLFYLYEINENGTILRNVKSKKQIKIFLDTHHAPKGYYTAFISCKKKVRRVTIHRVVAECWLGDCPSGMSVDHIDRNPHNNHYGNLRYATNSEQMKNRKLGAHVIAQATKNCYEYTMKYVAKAVTVTDSRNGAVFEFQSMVQCSKFLAEAYSLKSEHIRAKLKQRRSRIYDFDVKYSS